MNIQQWLTPLLKMAKRRKSSGKGMIWASIISVVISAIALRGLKKGQMDIPKNPLKSLTTQSGVNDIQKFLTLNDRSVLAEFAKEITPKTNGMNNNFVNKTELNKQNPL